MTPVSLELQRPWQITQREEEDGSWGREGGREGQASEEGEEGVRMTNGHYLSQFPYFYFIFSHMPISSQLPFPSLSPFLLSLPPFFPPSLPPSLPHLTLICRMPASLLPVLKLASARG